jgi:quinol monooxygenase YgiN
MHPVDRHESSVDRVTGLLMTRRLLIVIALLAVNIPALARQALNASSAPITILFSMTAKEGKDQELAALVPRLVRQSRADEGNLVYTFLQQRSNPREFVLFERWRDNAALKAHLAHLQATFGPPREGGSIPATILDLCDKTQAVTYSVIE